jgi:beta-glucan synthesis-associated protein KRE6
MGNLGRPGYAATTEGTWPYSYVTGFPSTQTLIAVLRYDSCDIGTFPNQTWSNQTGPASAIYSSASKEKYNYALSWLPGQKLSYVFLSSHRFYSLTKPSHSACTCPGEDHPGPTNTQGRGAPEIDVLEAEANKQTGVGQVVSQSAQFAPFTQDYDYDPTQFTIYNSQTTIPNTYVGSPLYVFPCHRARYVFSDSWLIDNKRYQP